VDLFLSVFSDDELQRFLKKIEPSGRLAGPVLEGLGEVGGLDALGAG
jgi:hypothetical protein